MTSVDVSIWLILTRVRCGKKGFQNAFVLKQMEDKTGWSQRPHQLIQEKVLSLVQVIKTCSAKRSLASCCSGDGFVEQFHSLLFLFSPFLIDVPLLLLSRVSWRRAVAEERVSGGPAVWEELSGHLLLLSCQLQSLRRGLRVSGGALPKHGGRVCHPRPLPLPWTGRPMGGKHTHIGLHPHKQTSAAQLAWQLVPIVAFV